MPTALITGITGQDGAYLTEFLLARGYQVHGIKRRASSFNTERIDHLYSERFEGDGRLQLHHGDLTDSLSLLRLIESIRPDEVYNLAAQSHVAVSFEEPEYTANADALGALRVLEALRLAGLDQHSRFYQASTSELYGLVRETPQSETTPFHPRSPYAVAKMYAYWITVNYREAYGMHASNGILFNHESPIRGETFVTRKITRGLARIWHGLNHTLFLGNLDARRDWGHARDFVEAMWLMLQQPQPTDLVIATGEQYSVRDFVQRAAGEMGIELCFEGTGVEEIGRIVRLVDTHQRLKVGDVIVRVHPDYFRPAEVQTLLGDASKARALLGWAPRTSFAELVREMSEADMRLAAQEASTGVARRHGRQL